MTNMHAALKQLALAAALGAFVVASPAAFADGKGQHKHGHKHQSDKHYYKDRDKAYKDYRKHVRKAQREDAKAYRRWARGQYIPRDYIVERYYVRDGHHRISVAQALGEAFIEAEIVRWQMR